MKTAKYFTIVFAVLILFATTIDAQGISLTNPIVKEKYSTIEANLVHGLKTDVEGLKISCAYYLGELKSHKAVLPLMEILRSDDSYPARIIAALSLIKIDDPQGVYMVKRTAQFNDQDGVRKMSEKFYLSYLWQKYLEQNPEKAIDLSFVQF